MSKKSIALILLTLVLSSCGLNEDRLKTAVAETVAALPAFTSPPPTEEAPSQGSPATQASADEFIIPPEGLRDMRAFRATNAAAIFEVNSFRVDGLLGDIFFVPELEGYSLWVGVWDNLKLRARLEHWNFYTLDKIGELGSGEIQDPRSLSGTADGGWLLTTGESSLDLWDVFSGRLPFEFEPSAWFEEAAIAPANSSPEVRLVLAVAYTSVDGTVVLYDLFTDETIGIFRHQDNVSDIDFSSDGRYLASGAINGSVFVIDVNQAQQTFPYIEDGWVDGVAIEGAPPGAGSTGHILATSVSGAITLWDTAFGTQIRDLAGHSADIPSMDFSPNGEVLASGDVQGTVKLWDVASGKEILTLTTGSSDILRIAFSPDGTLLAVAARDGPVQIWAVGP